MYLRSFVLRAAFIIAVLVIAAGLGVSAHLIDIRPTIDSSPTHPLVILPLLGLPLLHLLSPP